MKYACFKSSVTLNRVSFDGSDMKKSVFVNAVLSGTTFEGADLKDTDFTDAYLGLLKRICYPYIYKSFPKIIMIIN